MRSPHFASPGRDPGPGSDLAPPRARPTLRGAAACTAALAGLSCGPGSETVASTDGPSDDGTSATSDDTSATSGEGESRVSMVIPVSLDLCANGHSAVELPAAFYHNARLAIPAQTHDVGPLHTWSPAPEDWDAELPPGVPVPIDLALRFPNVDASAVQRLERSYELVAMRDRNIGGNERPGETVLFPTGGWNLTPGPLGDLGGFSFSVSAPTQPSGVVEVRAPTTREGVGRWWITAGCRMGDDRTCRVGPSIVPTGFGLEFVPCPWDGAPEFHYGLETEHGALELAFQAMAPSDDLFPPKDGLGLFTRFAGTFRGTPFEVTDLMRLSMASGGGTETGARNSYGVLFPKPIGDACGLIVENLTFEPLGDLDPLRRIGYEVTCDLKRGAAFHVMEWSR